MTPDAAVEFLALGYVLTPETAELRINAARAAGATEAECAEAWATWQQMRADDVQRIESQPAPRCRCSHTATYHVYGSGNCVTTACGCRHFRKPSPEPIDRQVS